MLNVIRRVRDRGVAVVLISHNMPDVLKVADRIEVLRLGRRVAQFAGARRRSSTLVGAMTGALAQEESVSSRQDPREPEQRDTASELAVRAVEPAAHSLSAAAASCRVLGSSLWIFRR